MICMGTGQKEIKHDFRIGNFGHPVGENAGFQLRVKIKFTQAVAVAYLEVGVDACRALGERIAH